VSAIRWTAPALVDYRNLISRIQLHNPRAATRIAERIDQRVSSLSTMPLIGRIGRVRGTRELVISGTPYLIVYEVVEDRDEIWVLRVLHGAMRWPPRGTVP
jgi:toxin ParE1/3/4